MQFTQTSIPPSSTFSHNATDICSCCPLRLSRKQSLLSYHRSKHCADCNKRYDRSKPQNRCIGLIFSFRQDVWCQSQISECPLICLQLPGEDSAATDANTCDPVSQACHVPLSLPLMFFCRRHSIIAVSVPMACLQTPLNILRPYPTTSAHNTTVTASPTATEIRHVSQLAYKIIHVVHKILQESIPQPLPQCRLPARLGLLLCLQPRVE